SARIAEAECYRATSAATTAGLPEHPGSGQRAPPPPRGRRCLRLPRGPRAAHAPAALALRDAFLPKLLPVADGFTAVSRPPALPSATQPAARVARPPSCRSDSRTPPAARPSAPLTPCTRIAG